MYKRQDYANGGKKEESKESGKAETDSKTKDTAKSKESKSSTKEKTKSKKPDKVKSGT